MESFATIRRRTTDLLQSIPQNLPAVPSIPARIPKQKNSSAMKGTWEKIDAPPLPRTSHSINIVNGSAYIFGGEPQPGRAADNDMHVITLPYNSAGADYYTIKAVPPKVYVPPSEPDAGPESVSESQAGLSSEPTTATEVPQDTPETGRSGSREGALDDVPLASPTTGADPNFTDDDDEEDTQATPTTTSPSQKGKQPEEPPPPTSTLPPLPAPRAGHATATLGHRIFVFGGRDPTTSQPLNEYGRVWVFDTRTRAWSFLDPVPPAPGVTLSPTPAPRYGHAAAATDRPRNFGNRDSSRKPKTWMEWAQGDSAEVGIPQAPIVGNVASRATDEEDEGYGTVFIHGGVVFPTSATAPAEPFTDADGKHANDLWAFDVHTRVWTALPAAPGPGRAGASICISKSRLFRFGGSTGSASLGGQLDFVHLEVETFADGVSRGEVSVRTRGGWQSIVSGADVPAGDAPAEGPEIPLTADQAWPDPRAFAGLEVVTSGAGREFLLLVGGELEAEATASSGTKCASDVWVFQVPPLGMTISSVRDAMLQVFGKPTGDGRWYRLEMRPYDEDDQKSQGGPAPRGWVATAPMGELEETGIVVWGGRGETGRPLPDGWILRLD
ncbi:hypothetical protein SODALDRAFT_280118 [Sodiomyces alkalinus F11]|uniref:Galactose oxidase n=1 Tax=Sodiomyces alkalinus (strain CBS 110278 / VKM F-3762 / F11) TaxID=1314773 RepID=A0A3N2PT71_SODAK|nr:hypothetical protein SODALDRAFT_280118 [Sodiomyces alkalinus F11]ROT37722.1 hypothetical protein SODALDRAFT_280118 [Sodiomyces alkalinus F11]